MTLWSAFVWIVGACLVGFAVTAIFSAWLRLSRDLFLIPYITLGSIFLVAFVVMNDIDVVALLRDNWAWGLVAGVLLAISLVFNVRSQPRSKGPQGARLVLEILWAGLLYGLMDGILLSVMPVVAIWEGTRASSWFGTLPGTIAAGALGLIAATAVSVAYHLGYREFRGDRIKYAVIGPGLMTLGVLVSGSPLAAIISHPVMHIAAVIHGPDTTVQLPPHRRAESESQTTAAQNGATLNGVRGSVTT